MHRIFVVLFYLLFVNNINKALTKPSTSIDEHAVELAELTEKVWSFRPAILQRTKPIIYCQVIDKCCDDEDRLDGISLIGRYSFGFARYHLNQLIQSCMNSTYSDEDQICSTFPSLIISQRTAYQDPYVKQYMDLIDHYEKVLLKIYFRLLTTCTGEQVHALVCSTHNKKLIETCTGNILQQIYDKNDYKNYQEIVHKTKQTLTDLIGKLSEIYNDNINIK